jgi:F0F1-type ATP synthase assembly protein I
MSKSAEGFSATEEKSMSARRKLNAAFFNGSLIVAALVGWLFGSWTVFALILVVLVIGNFVAGEIRPDRRHRDNRRSPPK